ncbi:MAG: carboxypeptidase-like regulatory domain-containing protein, partial [Candidatus Hinthialibacter sp.]
SDPPRDSSREPQARRAAPPAPSLGAWDIPFIPGKDDELGYVIICQIHDASGAPLPGASVALQSLDPQEYRFSSTTSDQGLIRLLALQPQTYSLIVQATGFIPIRESVALTPSSPRTQIRAVTLQRQPPPSPLQN